MEKIGASVIGAGIYGGVHARTYASILLTLMQLRLRLNQGKTMLPQAPCLPAG